MAYIQNQVSLTNKSPITNSKRLKISDKIGWMSRVLLHMRNLHFTCFLKFVGDFVPDHGAYETQCDGAQGKQG